MNVTDLIAQGSPYALLVAALFTVVRGDWIPKRSHDTIVAAKVEGKDILIADLREQVQRERENGMEWQTAVREAHGVTEKAVDVAVHGGG